MLYCSGPSGSPYRFKAISVPTIPMIHRKIAAILFCPLLTPSASFPSGPRLLPQKPGLMMDLKSFDYFHEPVYDGKAQMIKNKTTRGIFTAMEYVHNLIWLCPMLFVAGFHRLHRRRRRTHRHASLYDVRNAHVLRIWMQ